MAGDSSIRWFGLPMPRVKLDDSRTERPDSLNDNPRDPKVCRLTRVLFQFI